MTPAVRRPISWWVGQPPIGFTNLAWSLVAEMNSGPAAKSVDPVQGLSVGLPKAFVTPKKRLGIAA